MKDFFKVAGWALAGVIFLGTVVVAGNFLDLELLKFFGVKRANVETSIYRESQSYVEGTRRELRDLRRQYAQAETEEERSALRYMVLQRADELDWSKLPQDLRDFLFDLEAK